MTPWIEAVFAKYGWLLIGLSFGFAAKYAMLIKRGVRIRMPLVLADILLLPMVALIAFQLIGQLGADAEMAALLAALSTVGADRLVRLATERFFKQVETEIGEVSERVRGTVRNEVAAEMSGKRIIDDTIKGTAPAAYRALDPRPAPDWPPDERDET